MATTSFFCSSLFFCDFSTDLACPSDLATALASTDFCSGVVICLAPAVTGLSLFKLWAAAGSAVARSVGIAGTCFSFRLIGTTFAAVLSCKEGISNLAPRCEYISFGSNKAGATTATAATIASNPISRRLFLSRAICLRCSSSSAPRSISSIGELVCTAPLRGGLGPKSF